MYDVLTLAEEKNKKTKIYKVICFIKLLLEIR